MISRILNEKSVFRLIKIIGNESFNGFACKCWLNSCFDNGVDLINKMFRITAHSYNVIHWLYTKGYNTLFVITYITTHWTHTLFPFTNVLCYHHTKYYVPIYVICVQMYRDLRFRLYIQYYYCYYYYICALNTYVFTNTYICF